MGGMLATTIRGLEPIAPQKAAEFEHCSDHVKRNRRASKVGLVALRVPQAPCGTHGASLGLLFCPWFDGGARPPERRR